MSKTRLSALPLLFAMAILLFSVVLLASCDKNYKRLSEKRMADVLYDLHMAQAMVHQCHPDSGDYYQRLYREAILNKYGITSAELDSNLLYYTTNTEKILRIYTKLASRDAGSDMVTDMTAMYASGGDTANVWKDATRVLLVANSGNSATFTVETDTLIQPGDRLEWRLNASAIYPEGERNAYASIRLQYADSIATFGRNVGGYGPQYIDIPLSATRKLRRIYITLQQNTTWSERTKLLEYTNIHLLRIRPQKQKLHEELPDTTSTDAPSNTQDSLAAPHDTLRPLPRQSNGVHPLTPGRRVIARQ